jgi:enediyne biosynthesis protein E4
MKTAIYKILGLSIPISLGLFSCKKMQGSSSETLFTKLESKNTQVNFRNDLPTTDSLSILDYLYFYNGGGVSAGDINNDGKVDLFFVSNRGENKLYLNEGNMKFTDVSLKAGIKGTSNWKTGVSMVDINADGFLDIYVNAVGKYKGINGRNELYINNKNGTFTESAEAYNLAFKGFSTQTTFFDYDKDGDLDAYILTHAVHSVSSYDRVSARALRDGEAGDYLMRNDNGKFTDVSAASGIYGAAMGYGLGIVTADINNDGWDDIYVSNDFHEDDYYYINQKNGTFKESVKGAFKHLSKYSMGCDVADVNNDGYLDVFTTDMHPEDETTEKLSLGEDAYDIYMYKLQFGFYNQYSRNCLQINNKGNYFQDISMQAGVAATDWSWSPILADFDNDGLKDLFVSNGIAKRPNNMDYIKFLGAGTDSLVAHSIPVFGQKINDKKALDKMPSGKNHNYIFKGTDGWKYEDKSADWGFTEETTSNGAVYADLDNDGDLDIISNDLNAEAAIYKNNSEKINPGQSYLNIKLKGNDQNTQGIGAKVYIQNKGNLQYFVQQPTRGFMSSHEPLLHFGTGAQKVIDSLIVIWPNQKMQIIRKVKTSQTIILKQENASLTGADFKFEKFDSEKTLNEETLNQAIVHKENDFIDFIREPLVPFLSSSRGPKYAFADVNADGLIDMYQCGARLQAPILAFQNASGQFLPTDKFASEAIYEDNDAAFFDADGDKDMDLYVVSGGNEFYEKMSEIKDRLYLNDGKGNFSIKTDALPDAEYPNKSCVRPMDFDKDGDIDLFVGGHTISSNYGVVPKSYVWINNGQGKFTDQTPKELQKIGMVTDALWTDYDMDGWQDLIVVGDWMGIQVFKNEKAKLVQTKTGLELNTGFWSGIATSDIDGDGDQDYVIGNLGTNTKYIKQAKPKLRMYANDMDGNSIMEQIIAYEKNGDWYPAATRDDLSRMAPGLINSRFPEYSKYAGKKIETLFTDAELKGPNARMVEVNTFESVFIENIGGGKFALKYLPKEVQVSKIMSSAFIDIDTDGKLELLMGGNLYGVSTYQGRYDASYGHVLAYVNGEWKSKNNIETGFVLDGEVRDIKQVQTKTKNLIWVGRNNKAPQVFNISKKQSGI